MQRNSFYIRVFLAVVVLIDKIIKGLIKASRECPVRSNSEERREGLGTRLTSPNGKD